MNKISLKDFIMMNIGSFIIAVSVFFFMVPSDIPLGGVTGIAIIINKVVPIKVSLLTMGMNVLLLIIGYIFIGKEFGAKTIYTALMYPAIMAVFEMIFPNNTSIMGDQVLDIVCFLFVCSVGQAILFRVNASSGGVDIIAKLMNKYLRMELGKAISIAGLCSAMLSAFVYDAKTVLMAMLGTYVSGMVLDHFIFSFGGKKKVCVISDKSEEIKRFILDTVNRGATIYHAYGAFDGQPRTEIVTLVDDSEYKKLVAYISKVDPKAFVSVYSVNEVLDSSVRTPKKS